MDMVKKAVDTFRAMHNAIGKEYDKASKNLTKILKTLSEEETVVYNYCIECYFMGEDDAHIKITGHPAE